MVYNREFYCAEADRIALHVVDLKQLEASTEQFPSWADGK
jgi:hypothetical protein